MIGHNGEAESRRPLIREIKAEIDDCNSLIAEISERRKRAKGRIKSDLGEKVADFNVLCRFADLEEDPRSDLFRLVREGFEALGVGSQVSFLDVLDPQMSEPNGVAPDDAAPKAKRERKSKPKKTIAEEIAQAVIQHGLKDEVISQSDIDEFVESESALQSA